jgi:hypothetical protein
MPPTTTSSMPSAFGRTVAPTCSDSFMISRSRWSASSLEEASDWLARWIAWLSWAIVSTAAFTSSTRTTRLSRDCFH